jgi:P4 family phage/plasmid primase-like protien
MRGGDDGEWDDPSEPICPKILTHEAIPVFSGRCVLGEGHKGEHNNRNTTWDAKTLPPPRRHRDRRRRRRHRTNREDRMSSPARPFADSVLAYAQAGWPCIMPVPPAKSPPPTGFTGADGRDTDPIQLATWAGTHATSSVALRMPDGVIGIDVDQYVKGSVEKHGADTFAAALGRLGPLPATWTSTARGPGQPSRIYFFRAPAQRYATKLPGGDVEIIQRHHRYAVVWPSPHTDAGDIYRWYDPAGHVVEQPPKPGELPELPQAWVEGLREGATEQAASSADPAAGEAMLTALLADERIGCPEIVAAATHALEEVSRVDAGSRHDTMTGRAHQLVQLGAAGHPGVGTALLLFRLRWAELTAGEDREAEFDRMLLTSARKAVTTAGPRPVVNDPCTLTGGIPIAEPAHGGPAPADDRPGHEAPDPIEQPRDLHPVEVIGNELFSPRAHLDQRLADAVLERMRPVLRFGYDEGTWLLRERVSWAARPDLAEWAIAQVADMMPRGNPDAEKGSEDREQAEQRKRLMSSSPAGAVAKKMRARVAGGSHPCALRIAELDSEPWLLWAGGVGWDLTASRELPYRADIDPATPHLRSAAVTPFARPTPLWDAFLAAVWPDEALRGWALRVLAIAATGYADRALPILLGERGRGKTQVVALLMSVLGSYAHAADPRLLNGLDNAHASIIYALKGRRLSFIDEGPREGRLGQERLKQLTGGGDLTGNQMNRNPITFTPTHTLVLTANDDPILTDPAIRDRVRLIPCEGDPDEVRATRRAIGHTTSRAWRREAPGVLALLMREAAAWLGDPDSALTAAAPALYQERVEQLVLEQEPVRTWVGEECEAWPAGERSRALYEAFVGWTKNGNTHPGRIPSETKWGKELSALGYPIEKRRDGNYRPLRLKPRTPWAGPTVIISAQPAAPVSDAEIGGGLVEACGGLVSQPSTHHDPMNSGPISPSNDLVEGVGGRITSMTRMRAHDAHAHETQPVNAPHPPQPSTPLAADPAAILRRIPTCRSRRRSPRS